MSRETLVERADQARISNSIVYERKGLSSKNVAHHYISSRFTHSVIIRLQSCLFEFDASAFQRYGEYGCLRCRLWKIGK